MKALFSICMAFALSACSTYHSHYPSTTSIFLGDGEPGYVIDCGNDALQCIRRAGNICGPRGYTEVNPTNLRILPTFDEDRVLIIKCKAEIAPAAE